jgi:hypothetical protein
MATANWSTKVSTPWDILGCKFSAARRCGDIFIASESLRVPPAQRATGGDSPPRVQMSRDKRQQRTANAPRGEGNGEFYHPGWTARMARRRHPAGERKPQNGIKPSGRRACGAGS